MKRLKLLCLGIGLTVCITGCGSSSSDAQVSENAVAAVEIEEENEMRIIEIPPEYDLTGVTKKIRDPKTILKEQEDARLAAERAEILETENKQFIEINKQIENEKEDSSEEEQETVYEINEKHVNQKEDVDLSIFNIDNADHNLSCDISELKIKEFPDAVIDTDNKSFRFLGTGYVAESEKKPVESQMFIQLDEDERTVTAVCLATNYKDVNNIGIASEEIEEGEETATAEELLEDGAEEDISESANAALEDAEGKLSKDEEAVDPEAEKKAEEEKKAEADRLEKARQERAKRRSQYAPSVAKISLGMTADEVKELYGMGVYATFGTVYKSNTGTMIIHFNHDADIDENVVDYVAIFVNRK